MAATKTSSKFLSASIAGSLLSLVRLGAGFVRVKYIAVFLGAAGVGLLSQGNQLSLLGITLGSLTMAVGVITRLKAKTDEAAKRRMLGTAFTVQLTLSLTMVLFALAAPELVSTLVFGETGHALKCIAVMLGVPLAVMASGYLEGILFGSDRYDLYVTAAVGATILSLACFIPLVELKGIDGAFWAILANGACLFVCFLACTLRIRPLRELFRLGFDAAEFKALLKYSFVILATTGLGYVVNLFLRRHILLTLGAEANGIAQVPLAMTAYYTPFLTNALWGRLHPIAAEKGDVPEARHELVQALRYTMLFATGIIVSVLLLQEKLVQLTYSTAFLDALPLMPIQFLGDFFYFIAFTYGVYYLGVGRLRTYMLGWAAYYALLAGVFAVLVPQLKLQALPCAHLFASAPLASLALAHWILRVSADRETALTAFIVACCGLVVMTEVFLVSSGAAIAWRSIAPAAFAILFGARWLRNRRKAA